MRVTTVKARASACPRSVRRVGRLIRYVERCNTACGGEIGRKDAICESGQHILFEPSGQDQGLLGIGPLFPQNPGLDLDHSHDADSEVSYALPGDPLFNSRVARRFRSSLTTLASSRYITRSRGGCPGLPARSRSRSPRPSPATRPGFVHTKEALIFGVGQHDEGRAAVLGDHHWFFHGRALDLARPLVELGCSNGSHNKPLRSSTCDYIPWGGCRRKQSLARQFAAPTSYARVGPRR